MQIRCYRCNWSFAIKSEEVVFALEALEESGGSHYDAHCPRCRRTTKIPLETLRRAAPRITTEEEKQDDEESDLPDNG